MHKSYKKSIWNLESKKRLRSIRRILKLLLVGFFVLKDIEKTISELTSEKKRILTGINELLCEELETVGNQVKKIWNSDTYLIYVDKEQCMHNEFLEMRKTTLSVPKLLHSKLSELLLNLS